MGVVKGQGHTIGPISLTHFLFISHQSDQPFWRWSYIEIWLWNIQGWGHEWGQRSRSHILPSSQPMHVLFVSHQSDQPFLRYGQNSVWTWKNTSTIFNSNLQKIIVFNRISSKSKKMITMTRATKLSRFVMNGSHLITQISNFFLIDATAMTLGQGHGKVIQYISPHLYILCAYIKGLAPTVSTWEGKVYAAADTDGGRHSGTNWKHKVTPVTPGKCHDRWIIYNLLPVAPDLTISPTKSYI